MAKRKKKLEILTTRKAQGDIVRLPSSDFPEFDIIVNYIEENYSDSVGCIIPEGYKIALVLKVDDKIDSRNDKWDLIVFDIAKDNGIENQTITLDNLDSLEETLNEEGETKLIVVKSISGHFEEMIHEIVNIIRKYKGKGQ